MERKTLPCELKASLNSWEFEGLAAAFHNIDAGGDIIAAGAFKKSLPEFMRRGKIVYQHQWQDAIGKPLATEETPEGLFTRGRLSDTTLGRDVRTLMLDGVISELSIGYVPTNAEQLKSEKAVREYWESSGYKPTRRDIARCKRGARLLKEIDLLEYSPVTFAMNEDAQITAVKGASQAKAELLGPYVEQAMTWAALSRLNDVLWYRVIYDCIFSEDVALDECLSTISAAIDEFKTIALGAIEALMRDSKNLAGEADAFKATWPDPANKEGSPAGLSLAVELDSALAAVAGVIDRSTQIQELRQKDGRSLSAERRGNLAKLQEKLNTLLQACAPRVDEKQRLSLEADLLRARLAANRAMLG